MRELKTKEDFIKALKEVYTTLDKGFPVLGEGNPCGTCFYCCTIVYKLNVSKLEMDYIKENVTAEDFKQFVEYVNQRKEPLLKEADVARFRCNFYDPKLQGCRIYPLRPYTCRVFGVMDTHRMPEFCVYYNPEGEIPVDELYDKVPALKDYRELIFRYDLFTAGSKEEAVNAQFKLAEELFAQMRNVESLQEFKKVLLLAPKHKEALEFIELLKNYES